MPFELRITEIDYDNRTPRVSGRLVAGRYFGPEEVELALEDGRIFRTAIGSMGASSMGANGPRGWPILPKHDIVLQLELLAQPPGRIAVGSILRGIGLLSSSPIGRRPSNDWLDAPLFWAMHYYLLAMDGEKEVSDLCEEVLGISLDEINEFYLERFTSERQPQPWPFFSLAVTDFLAIEVEYADAAEYQIRYKIADADGVITVGYQSGHFSLPSLRWPEVLAIANASQDSLRRHQLILLLFPGIYVGASDQAEATQVLEESFAHLRLFNASGRSALAMSVVQNRRIDSHWVNDERLGWISKSEYAQRNPRSLLSTLAEPDFLRIKAFFDHLNKSPTKGSSNV